MKDFGDINRQSEYLTKLENDCQICKQMEEDLEKEKDERENELIKIQVHIYTPSKSTKLNL